MTPDAREQARHISEVTKAYADSATIQETPKGLDEWYQTVCPKWDWLNYDYRVKPEERKPREWDSWENNGDIIGHPVGENVTDEMLVALGWKRIRVVEVLPSENTGKVEA